MNLQQKLPPFWICILLDTIGLVTYLIPGWGEWVDIGWAPISAFLFYLLFGGKTGVIGAIINFIEESVPFADAIPMFTIGYFVRRREISQHSNTLESKQ
jgi:hypothetical protein